MEQQTSNGTNGHGAYSSQNGSSATAKETLSAPKKKPAAKKVRADRQGITEVFEQFGQLLHASNRPVPTQNGDGTYNDQKKRTGLKQDLKVLRWKGECGAARHDQGKPMVHEC